MPPMRILCFLHDKELPYRPHIVSQRVLVVEFIDGNVRAVPVFVFCPLVLLELILDIYTPLVNNYPLLLRPLYAVPNAILTLLRPGRVHAVLL